MRKHLQGFTLVELLVAIALFSILVGVGVGGFVHALHTQGEISSLIAAQSNASVALEQMAREIRTGYLFCNDVNSNGTPRPVCDCHLSGTDSWSCSVLDFYNADSENVQYKLENGALVRDDNGTGDVPITANNVYVADLGFNIFGATEGDQWPARITISLGVVPSSTDPALTADVANLQTTVSAREIDCLSSGATPC